MIDDRLRLVGFEAGVFTDADPFECRQRLLRLEQCLEIVRDLQRRCRIEDGIQFLTDRSRVLDEFLAGRAKLEERRRDRARRADEHRQLIVHAHQEGFDLLAERDHCGLDISIGILIDGEREFLR